MVIEAAIFNLPIINVCTEDNYKTGFGKTREHYLQLQDLSVDLMQKHNQALLKSGGAKTVYRMDELYEVINEYLENPEIDAEGRKLIVEKAAGPFHGNAGKMIGDHILSLAGCDPEEE